MRQRRLPTIRFVCAALLIGSPGAAAQVDYKGPAMTLAKIANGVYATVFANPVDAAMNGNGIVIVNDSDVLVVDTQDTPAAARSVIAAIRTITHNPVRYVVNTHFHGDHHFGNAAYREAFPGVEFISHPNTRADALNEEVPDLEKYVHQGLPDEITSLERLRDTCPVAKRPAVDSALARDRWWLAQLRQVQVVPAGLLVADSIVLVRGDRTIEIRYLGRGNTRGDLIVYLPREQVLVTGDLLVSPMPYAVGSYLGDWIAALNRLRALPVRAIVPGHGEIQYDFAYLDLVKRLLESTLAQARQAVANGLDLEATRRAVNIDSLRSRFTAGDPRRRFVFDANYTTPAVERAWLEARGPL